LAAAGHLRQLTAKASSFANNVVMKPQQMKISLVLPTIRTDAEFSCEDFMDLEGA